MGYLRLYSREEVHDTSCQPKFSNFHFWRELSDRDKQIISDSREVPLFNVINGLEHTERKSLYSYLQPTDIPHYIRTQLPWIHRAKELVAHELHIPVTNVSDDSHLAPNLDLYGTPIKYRLYYAARFPNKVGVSDDAPDDSLHLISEFFTDCRHALIMAGLDYSCES